MEIDEQKKKEEEEMLESYMKIWRFEIWGCQVYK